MVNSQRDSEVFNIYIGWDAREPIAFDVLEYSIRRRTSANINIIPLKHRQLRKEKRYDVPSEKTFKRPWGISSEEGFTYDLIDGKPFSTEFAFTRFLVPYLNNFEGWAIFMDSDMLCQADIQELIDLRDDRYAVMVRQHKHEPSSKTKMDDQPQSRISVRDLHPWWEIRITFLLWNSTC